MNLTDQFLIASPGLNDPVFEKTVSYICSHTHEGALGITINRPTNLNLAELLTELDIELKAVSLGDLPVYLGGPVETGHGFILHTGKDIWQHSLVINEQMILTSSRDILDAIAIGEGPDEFLVALGYSGWGEGQLEKEMLENAWLTVPADKKIIFDIESHLRWENAALKLGVDIHLMSTQAGHA